MRLITRLTLLFAVVSTAVLLALGFVLSSAVEKHFAEEDAVILQNRLESAERILDKFPSGADDTPLAQQLDDALLGYHGLGIVVVTPRGENYFAAKELRYPQALLDKSQVQTSSDPFVWQAENIAYRGIVAHYPNTAAAPQRFLIAVAMDISHHEIFMRDFRQTLWLFVAVAAALSALLGWLAASRGLAPLRAMRARAANVTAQRLHQRLPTEKVPRELADLAGELNAMFSRLQEAFERLADFSSNLAHELRTPVNTLLTQTQVTLSKARSVDDYRSVLESNAEEFERLAKMIGDMLFLARAENGIEVARREEIDLAVEIDELFDFFDALREEKQVRLQRKGQARIAGDRLMLRRACANILGNALRHTPAGGEVRILIEQNAAAVRIAIGNSGETIAPQHLKRLFDRFYRADPARVQTGESSGLGLAIVKSIVQAHGGSVGVTSADGWTEFVLLLPTDAEN